MLGRLSVLGALLVGAAVVSGVFVIVDDPILAGTTGLFWAIGLGLTAHHLRYSGLRRGITSDDWSVARWGGAFGGLATLGATVGVSPALPLPAGHRFGLGLLVLGVALTSVNLGAGAMIDVGPVVDEGAGGTADATAPD